MNFFFTINSDFDCPERKGHGSKGPGSELARERIGQSPIGRFAPGSELARERKGSVPRINCNRPSLRWREYCSCTGLGRRSDDPRIERVKR